jgi:hypothetical protein
MDDHFIDLGRHIERFQNSLPSEIKNDEIFALEKSINDLYFYVIEKQYPPELEEAVIDALSLTSSLVDEIRENKSNIKGPNFFRTIKHLANLLKLICYYAKQIDTTQVSNMKLDSG